VFFETKSKDKKKRMILVKVYFYKIGLMGVSLLEKCVGKELITTPSFCFYAEV
jgi:hypothetical protein